MTATGPQDTRGNGVDVHILRVSPVSALTVAAHILRRLGPLPALKLQKLVYYCQAWALVWEGRPIFPETIEARPYGPTVPELYERHRGRFLVDALTLPTPAPIDEADQETIAQVLAFYGSKSNHWLSQLIRQEEPWKQASHEEVAAIDHSALLKYYGEL